MVFTPWVYLMFNTYSRKQTNCYILPESIASKNKLLCTLVLGQWKDIGEYYDAERGGVTTVKKAYCDTKVFIGGPQCNWFFP